MIKIQEENDWELGGEGLKQALAKQGMVMGLSKVYRIKRMYDIYPKSSKKKHHNRKRYKDNIISENILNRQFNVSELNKVWVMDIKYIPTEEGWDYLAVVIDLCSRRVVGFAQEERMTVGLTRHALDRAVRMRRPEPGLICHSDRGSQYTCKKYQDDIRKAGFISSMSRPATPHDNACAESFFATLEKRFLAFRKFKTREEARQEIWAYIEGRYNSRRMHSSLNWMSPMEYEWKLKEEEMLKTG
jgi:putative transposase